MAGLHWLVLPAVRAGGVFRREDAEEVIIHVLGADGGESAEALEGLSLLVNPAIGASVLLRGEDGLEVIGQRLVAEFGKAARAPGSNQAINFL